MSARSGDKLVGGYVPAAFADAVERYAKAAGVSKSDVIRQAIARALLSLAEEPGGGP